MFSAPLTSCSMGTATFSSTTRALAPTKKVSTVMVGGLMGGYWAMGRVKMATVPAMTITREITMAKMGWRMKYLTTAPSSPALMG